MKSSAQQTFRFFSVVIIALTIAGSQKTPAQQRTQFLVTIPVRQRVWGLALTRDGKKLYAANGLSNDVSVIDTATNAVVATVQAGDGPWGIAIVGF